MKKLRVYLTIDLPLDLLIKDGHTVEEAIDTFNELGRELKETSPEGTTFKMRTEIVEE